MVKRLFVVIAVSVFFVCAYGQDVHYNYARGTNFQAYKTCQWVDIPGASVNNELVDASIKRSIDEQLAQKGLTKVEKGGDLLAAYRAGVSLEKSVDVFGTGMRNLSDWGAMDSASAHGQTSTIA